MSSYSDKFKDPRWQKKRLQILDRDGWACGSCCSEKSTLHVHHRIYNKGCDPWDYPDELLITLCASCHEYETRNMVVACQSLETAMRKVFLSDYVEEIASIFECNPCRHYDSSDVATAIRQLLHDTHLVSKLVARDEEQQNELMAEYEKQKALRLDSDD